MVWQYFLSFHENILMKADWKPGASRATKALKENIPPLRPVKAGD